jgi:hypothetical protein
MGMVLELALRYVESCTFAEIRASERRLHRFRFLCLDCRHDTYQNEYYALRKEVWLSANPEGDGMLCIGCVEIRIGRHLTPEDFTDVPLNLDYKKWRKSKRLLSRLRRIIL